ncbi:MAG: (2Fe-2S) ferredoxin domain-containing protein [Elusimicrobia bacterium]|nr:(2Fe-2S) ferredoxin domain-containing protein [Elusimicrobiota bacterium]
MKDETLGKRPGNWIRVGYSTCGIAAGADEVFRILEEEAKTRKLDVKIQKCGCLGLCSAEPLVEVNVEGVPHVFYGKVTKDAAHKIMDEHVCQKRLVENHIYEI